jgi:uncharacterized protein
LFLEAPDMPELELSALTTAIYRRDTEQIRKLLKGGAVPTFFEAAALGDVTTVKKFLEDDFQLARAFAADGFTALHLAAFFGRPEVVGLLLEYGADPNAVAKNPTNLRPVHSAAASGDAPTLKALLNADVDVNAKQERGFTALHEAALNGNSEMIHALLRKGADPDLRADDGRTAIDFARASSKENAIAALQPA